MTICRSNEFDFGMLDKIGNVKHTKQAYHNKGEIKDIISAFDIETTAFEWKPDDFQAVMYIWQWAFGPDLVVVGRTWEDWAKFVEELRKHLTDARLVVYVHNLSYEFQFISGVYPFTAEEVFAVKSRKILKCVMYDCIEFRCSYLHSNMNLDTYCKKFHVKHEKIAGFDYSKKRFPWTPLSDFEVSYCVHDVVGLVEALGNEMAADGDTLHTIPLTSTGYVRRDVKKALGFVSKKYMQSIQPAPWLYLMLREAFRGGNTHANRFYTGAILEDVKSADRSSSYPDVLVNNFYPVSRFEPAGAMGMSDYKSKVIDCNLAFIGRVYFTNIRLRDITWGCPYLSLAKCRDVENYENDNGRILSADYLETTVTDIDLKIIFSEYDFDDFAVTESAVARYGYLPAPMVSVIKDYYQKKTELKGVEGQEVYYMKSKNKLNSCYGMTAQDPVKQDIIYNGMNFEQSMNDIKEILEKRREHPFLAYQWGVWCTAWARLMLEYGIRLAHEQGAFIYTDTDSVKYLGDVDFSALNEKLKSRSFRNGAYAADPAGEVHYMGVYEPDGVYDRFITLGAKKYAAEEEGKISLTVAGVGKKAGAQELGALENFKPDFVFKEAGGLEAIYNDDINELTYIDGHWMTITKNVALVPSEYTLGITAEYERILRDAREILTGQGIRYII